MVEPNRINNRKVAVAAKKSHDVFFMQELVPLAVSGVKRKL
jgi:hypothetical protein